MPTYKKKYFKDKYQEEEELDELVNKDGAPIEGDKVFNSNSEIQTGPTLGSDDEGEEAEKGISPTTDDYVAQTKQRMRYPFYGSNYSSGKRAALPESHKILAKERMEGLIEDLMTQKSDSHDMVQNSNNQDINRNDVPDITDISAENQALGNKVTEIVRILSSQDVSGEDSGIVLNFMVSNMNMSQVPQDYKRIIKNKI